MKLKPLFIFLFVMAASISFGQESGYNDKHIEVALRTIGHQLLLSAGDSTSRVLPVQREDNTFIVSFESPFKFFPEDLVDISNEVMTENNVSSGYILEVEECENLEVVYSFEMDESDTQDLTPCRSRELPFNFYRLVLELYPATHDISGLPHFNGDQEERQYAITWVIAVVGFGIFVLFMLRRRTGPKDLSHQIKLGKYLFDNRSGKLIIDGENVELTGKENDLLSLLHQSVNRTVKREVILHSVWGDEGDYVGRTLDVFISKLRKKLEQDDSIKIANIRGVGYKLVVS